MTVRELPADGKMAAELTRKLLTKLIQPAQSDADTLYTTAERQRTITQLIAVIARQYPRHLTPYIDGIVVYTKNTVSTHDEELKNCSLQACTPLDWLKVY